MEFTGTTVTLFQCPLAQIASHIPGSSQIKNLFHTHLCYQHLVLFVCGQNRFVIGSLENRLPADPVVLTEVNCAMDCVAMATQQTEAIIR